MSDLGGLGAKTGSPVSYNWVLPSITPLLVPWLAVLGLLSLKPNRRAAAWLILIPLGCVAIVAAFPGVTDSGSRLLCDAAIALGFGVTAVWLLSDRLRRTQRLLTFLGVLFTMSAFGGFSVLARQGLDWSDSEVWQTGIILGIGALATTIALTLDGWICRRRFLPLGIYLWLLVALMAIWLTLALPFFVVALTLSSGSLPWREFFVPVLSVAFGNFLLLLPFFILSSASPLFRERLQALLHVQPGAPPLIAPTPTPELKS